MRSRHPAGSPEAYATSAQSTVLLLFWGRIPIILEGSRHQRLRPGVTLRRCRASVPYRRSTSPAELGVRPEYQLGRMTPGSHVAALARLTPASSWELILSAVRADKPLGREGMNRKKSIVRSVALGMAG